MKYFAENYPSLILTKHKGFESNLKSYQKMKNSVTIDKAFFPPNSQNFPEVLLNWYDNEKDEKRLVLSGGAGLGKTEGILSFLDSKDLRLRPLLVSNKNDLRFLTRENKSIVFDDICYGLDVNC